MRKILLAAAVFLANSAHASGLDGVNSTAVQNPLPMPFQRSGDPFLLPATTTPQQYVVTQPPGTGSYRGVNPCMTADVRIKSVTATMPVVSTATAYPGVGLVTSQADSVTAATGTRFIARTSETLGSVPDPIAGPQRVISIMLVPIPGYTADISNLTCVFELTYGNGG